MLLRLTLHMPYGIFLPSAAGQAAKEQTVEQQSRVIWKFSLSLVDEQIVMAPRGARSLSVPGLMPADFKGL